MRIIAKRTLRQFWERERRFADAKRALEDWLRAALDSLFSSATSLTEEKFHQQLAAEGRLGIPPPEARAHVARRPFKPVLVRGKPILETIIEERR